MFSNIVVRLAPGVYHLRSTLRLGPADSGRHGFDVRWEAAPGAKVTWSGGVRVRGWRLADAKRNIWVAAAPAGASPVLQMYVNGVRAVRDRSAPCPASQCKYTPRGIAGAPAAFGRIAHPDDMELVTHAHWRDFHCPVTGVVAKGATSELLLAEPCWRNANLQTQTGWQVASPSGADYAGVDYVENAYTLLGTPGQFYDDPRTARLYYVPRRGEGMRTARVIVPVVQTLLSVMGRVRYGDAPVRNVVFSGITFAYAAWRAPASADGYVGGQAGWTITGEHAGVLPGDGAYLTPPVAAVEVAGGVHVDFLHDTFEHLGAAGVALRPGTRDSAIRFSRVTDVSGDGIVVGGVDAHPAEPWMKAAGDAVTCNRIEHVAVQYRGGVGIWGGYQDGLVVAHNTIEHVPYTGISVGWGWNFVGNANVARDVVIAHNRIGAFMQALRDGGAIYVQGQSWNSRIEDNYIDYVQTHHGNAIYLDERSRYWVVSHNVVWGIPRKGHNWLSAWAPYSAYNVARGNWTTGVQTHVGSTLDFFSPRYNHVGLTVMPAAARHVVADAGSAACGQERGG
ncbi:MAG TPA: right-handed parallel beta-helix repeat-containing protein [Rhodanobacteraceae bacterium]